MINNFKFFVCILFITLILNSCKEKQFADFILINANIYTAGDSIYSPTAMAIKNGKILYIGNNESALEYKNKNSTIKDANNSFVMPGLNEGHGHLLSFGKLLSNINLLKTQSWEEIVDSVHQKAKTAPKGIWIEGRGWHQDKWKNSMALKFDNYPYHDELSKISPDHPVVLVHASGHALIANQKAMDMAKISIETQSPKGGRIVKDHNGKLTGVFEENAMDLINDALKSVKLDEEAQKKQYELYASIACNEALKYGITSFTDAGSRVDEIFALRDLVDIGKIPLRLNVFLYEDKNSILEAIPTLPIYAKNKSKFRAESVKAYIDGALGSYGAWLLEPYTDNPKVLGQNLMELSLLDSIASACDAYNLQLCVHAIGDRANREILNIYEKHQSNKKRWRIEHAQHIDPEDIIRFKQNNVIASMQAIHCTSDAPFVQKRLGYERAKNTSYRWRTILDAGVRLSNGTDVPVESINPFECLYASVTRKRMDNNFEFFPEEKMTREEALKSYTIWNAYSSNEDHIKGSLEVGKLADFIILDKDLLKCKDEEIPKTKVLEVYIEGNKII